MEDKLYFIGLINTLQNVNNNFVNIDEEDLETLMQVAKKNDMSEIEIQDAILDLNYA